MSIDLTTAERGYNGWHWNQATITQAYSDSSWFEPGGFVVEVLSQPGNENGNSKLSLFNKSSYFILKWCMVTLIIRCSGQRYLVHVPVCPVA
ncbi:hypothetical protein KSX_72540 [Ktedonospora formicarum]|uniref:Uncharacterized protein n=1 Tax=Ktedonospora formicarum TaxID=2778364 RepID=A0A8J3MWK5_9CHLR|nr:hypothetical protein KSX_72540 [Ktedonospora formicarum]